MNRTHFIWRIAKALQNLSFVLLPFEFVLQIFSKKREGNNLVVFLLAPPRSGSTLCYQILTAGLQVNYLSNLSNVLYRTPLLGLFLTQRFINLRKHSFESNQGAVKGLFGEAEGKKYWEYYFGQGLRESQNSVVKQNVRKLRNAIDRSKMPFVTGYLGHVFSDDQIKMMGNQVIIIKLTRDIDSNVNSLYRLNPTALTSIIPLGIPRDVSVKSQVRSQIEIINEKIQNNFSNINAVEVTYSELCQNPHNFLQKVQDLASSMGFSIESRKSNVPKKFTSRNKR